LDNFIHELNLHLNPKEYVMSEVLKCQYCNEPAKLVGGEAVYPHRKDLYTKRFWLCTPCEAHCGCHPGTDRPLGVLAKKDLRKWKSRVHDHFDPIWRGGAMKRKEAYLWLANELGIEFKDCHVGLFSLDQCKKAIGLCITRNKP